MKKLLHALLLYSSMQLSAQSINVNSATATLIPGGVEVNIQGIGYNLLHRLGHTYSIENNQINVSVCYYVTPLTMIDNINDDYFIPTTEVSEYTVNLTIYSSLSQTECDYNQIEYTSTYLNLNSEFSPTDNTIKVFPNPSHGIVQIDSGNVDVVAVKVYDISGKLLIDTNAALVDLSNLESGIYIVNIATEKTTYSKKIILQK